MKKQFLTVPNLLSLSRVVFLPLLVYLVLLGQHGLFLLLFIAVGSTDFFDGYVARRFNMVTETGKMLDSTVDVFFYVATAWFFYQLHPEYLMAPNSYFLIVFFSLFALSFIVSFVRCGKPIMMHTFLLRLNGVLVYFLITPSYFLNTTYFVTAILIIYIVAIVEEMVIFVRFGQVDPDTPSLLSLLERAKKERAP